MLGAVRPRGIIISASEVSPSVAQESGLCFNQCVAPPAPPAKVETDAARGNDLHARWQCVDAGGIEPVAGSAQETRGDNLMGAADDLNSVTRAVCVVKV